MTIKTKNTVIDGLTEEQKNDFHFLFEKATEYEQSDLESAYQLISLANKLRPNAPRAQHKLALYSRRLSQLQSSTPLVSDGKHSAVPKAHAKLQEQRKRLQKIRYLPSLYFLLCVILPWSLFAFYTVVVATPRYESQALLLIKQPDGASTLDASMALLSGFTGASSHSDPHILKAYVHSQDMLEYIERHLPLREHFTDTSIDFISRLDSSASKEKFLDYFHRRISVYIDDKSGVITLSVQGFSPQFTQRLTQLIVERAEWYINDIGHHLATRQLEFVKGENQRVEDRLAQAQRQLLALQREHNLLDPVAEGAAMQQIAYTLEGQIAIKEAELKGLLTVMHSGAPQVVALKNELQGLTSQLQRERKRLVVNQGQTSVSEILSQYMDLKVSLDMAMQAYQASQVSLEKSRIEAYRQLKYLITIQNPTKPEEASYPEVQYNLLLAAVLLLLLFGIGKIIIATIKELG